MAASDVSVAAVPLRTRTTARDFLQLTKPGLSLEVLFTTAGGIWMSGEKLSAAHWVVTMLATFGVIGAANTFNCYLERDSDRFMKRTAVRPLPGSRMEPRIALMFGFVLAAGSLPALALGANLLTAVLGLTALLSYVLVYTPMKPRTHWAMVVGAFPGALPPLMGWTAATGKISVPGLVLFAILFFWQLPHFIAIALFRKEEYQRAGLTSLPLQKGDAIARKWAVIYLVGLLASSVLPYVLNVAGLLYLVVAIGLGAWFFFVGVKGWWLSLDAKWARQFFFVSLIYLTGLFTALGIDAQRF